MRDDLLDAQASVDWAISNFPSFEERLNSFIKDNLNVVLEDEGSDSPYYSLAIIEKAPFPLALNVEVGAYINAIRSSLDILATALAYRHRHTMVRPDKAYFPMAKSAAEFASFRDYKGAEFVKGLPSAERTIIESLKPYRGSDGNTRLALLHDLDIERKHRRLLNCQLTSAKVGVRVRNAREVFVPHRPGFIRTANKTEIGKLSKSAAQPKIEAHSYISFDEAFLPKGTRQSCCHPIIRNKR
jgi:hypothetical protein